MTLDGDIDTQNESNHNDKDEKDPLYRQHYILYQKQRIAPAYSIKFEFENPMVILDEKNQVIKRLL